MHHLLGMDEHAIWHRVVVADDRIDQFVDEGVGWKPNFSPPRSHGARTGAGVSAASVTLADKTRGDAGRTRHATDAAGCAIAR